MREMISHICLVMSLGHGMTSCWGLYSEEEAKISVQRHKEALITVKTPGAGTNICGPSVVRVPAWVKNPKGKYYMYFASHSSSALEKSFIRFAYANDPKGPWTVDNSKVLRRSQLKDISEHKKGDKPIRKKQHIASPDVIFDDEKQEFVMCFHGAYKGHNTGAATSKDGLHWEDQDVDLGDPYLRVFEHHERYYGFSQGSRAAKATRIVELEGRYKVTKSRSILNTNWRHLAVYKLDSNKLLVFYSRYLDEPGRIMASLVDVTSEDIHEWVISKDVYEVIRPEYEYEGSAFPITPSGSKRSNIHELRDPCIFVDEEKVYLYYSIKGEMGIAAAELKMSF